MAPIAPPEPAEAAIPPSIRPEPVHVDIDRSDLDRLDVGRAEGPSLQAATVTAVGPTPVTAVGPTPVMASTATIPAPTIAEDEPDAGPVAEPVFAAAVVASVGEAPPADEAMVADAPVQLDASPVRASTCTTAQLRRFIKSRAYMPMHELRRRFLINGSEDDVTLVEVDGGTLFVGLPEREGRMLGDLLRGGEVGYELSHDPVTPIVVGVFPMRPIPRP
ncbi:MAG TPA: hypothetical protein VEG29_04415 [Candidatus Binatia bacterium]|nr:hypothetical protein [Candidatus Binatia bacterium]